MTTLADAFIAINGALTEYLTPMLEDQTINELVIGGKQRGSPKPPSLGIIYYPIPESETTIGSTARTSYEQEIRIRGLVKELENPTDGFMAAVGLVSTAQNLILQHRQLGIPDIVRDVKNTKIEVVPFPIGKKASMYAADSYFKILFIIDNL